MLFFGVCILFFQLPSIWSYFFVRWIWKVFYIGQLFVKQRFFFLKPFESLPIETAFTHKLCFYIQELKIVLHVCSIIIFWSVKTVMLIKTGWPTETNKHVAFSAVIFPKPVAVRKRNLNNLKRLEEYSRSLWACI